MKHKTYDWKASERAIIEKLPVLMIVFQYWADKRELRLVTDACCETFKYTREQMTALFHENKKSILHPDDAPRYHAAIERLLEDPKEAIDITMRIRTSKAKSYRWFRVRLTAAVADKDSILVYAVHTDINDVQEEMRQTEEESARTDNLLENILNIAPVSIFWKDTKRRFLGANRTFLDYFGYDSVEEIVGKTDDQIGWHKDDVNFSNDEMRALNGEVTYLAHGKCVAKGRERNIAVCKAPVYRDGKIVGLVGSFLDVTETYEQEQQIGQLNKMLNESLEHEKEVNRATNEFMSRMSHEIRTPMNAIIGLSNLGIKNAENPQAKDYLMKINSSGQYLLGIINDVLDIRKIEGGDITLVEERMYLPDILGAVNTMIRPLAEAKDITYTVDYKKVKELWAIGDQMRLQQILINLLNNAVKFTDPGGKVSLTVSQKLRGKQMLATFVVEDNGCGMKPEFLTRIFGSFAQENRNPGKYGTGTGLGLSISRKFARLMDGDITVKSVDGEGSIFTVTAVYQRTEQEETATDKASINKEADISTLTGCRVLLAEDNEINVEVAKGILENAGIEVETAVNGLQAIELFSTSAVGYYDVILMDIQMPVIDGYKATEAIRSLDRADASKVPVIAMSADIFSDTMEKAHASGMVDYITKPIDVWSMFNTLQIHISTYRKEKQKITKAQKVKKAK